MKIEGKLTLVTGGGRGLGLAIAEHLADKGAKVIIVDKNKELIQMLPEKIMGYQLDITKIGDVKKCVNKITENYGPIAILVNNAGNIFNEPFINFLDLDNMIHSYRNFKKVIKVNMDSVFIMTSAIVKNMIKERIEGVIVNISSVCSKGNEGQTAYSAAKAGVNAMTVTWAKELGRIKIRCNAISPGFISTNSTFKALNSSKIKHIIDNTPLRKMGDPIDVAMAVSAVIENDYINGAVLDVNGGLSI